MDETRPPTTTTANELAMAVLETIDDGCYIVDAQWRFLYFNRACELYFQRERETVLGRPISEVVRSARLAALQTLLTRAAETGEVQREEFVSPLTGTPILIRVMPQPMGFAVLFSDASDRFEAIAARRRSDDRYRTLFNSLDVGFCVVQMIIDEEARPIDYRFVEVNPDFERQTGLTDVVGKTMLDLNPQHESHWFERYGEVALTGRSVQFEARAEGLGDRWYSVSAFRVGEAGERNVGVLFNDVTERHRSQDALRDLNEVLEARVATRTQELQDVLQEMEAFNYSVSHDLRAPLRNVAGMAAILLEEAGPGLSPDHRQLLERQTMNVRRMTTLIEALLQLSRLSRAELNRKSLDLTTIAREIAWAERSAHPGGAIVDVQEGMGADGDPSLVHALLQNLIDNALKFSPQGGTVRVGVEGGVFTVSDEGVGFDMAYVSKLFVPFSRLVREAEFPGTGIGLANVDRIVRRHGGRVWVSSEPGKGTTFSFTLPPASSTEP